MLPSLITTAWVFLAALGSQQDNAPPNVSARPATDVMSKLRAEAARLERAHASDFFAAMIEAAQPGNREGLTDKVLELSKQADQVARDALQFWLVRALASGSKPPTLQEWQDLRARIVGHAEAIVLEAVLRPGQAQRWRNRASRPLMPSLPGRYSIIPIDYPDGHFPSAYTRAEYYNTIDLEQYGVRASDLFAVLLGYNPVKPFPGLTTKQVEALEGVDLLARNVKRYWWMRDVEEVPNRDNDPKGIRELPPTPAMELRLSDRGRMHRASIVAHAEEIALEAVLTPEGAELAKRELWRNRGLHALLDPELAARLRLSKAQRAELAEALKARLEVYHKLVRSGVVVSRRRTPAAVVEALEQQRKDEIAQDVAALDQPIWEILNPSQLRSLARLLNKPVAGYDPPKPNAKSKLRGREG